MSGRGVGRRTGPKREAVIRFRTEDHTDRWRNLTIIAQDAWFMDPSGKVVTSTIRIPNERLEPGPRGHRLHVVDVDRRDPSLLESPVILDRDLAVPDDLESEGKKARAFHAQNVYAVTARTLAKFESALGRRVRWSFGGHQLYLVPHAFEEANAYYAEEDHAIYYGYFTDARGKRAFNCLSYDIIAHETTHAILDGLRDRFDTPGLPDQAAFHEGFADVVALLSAFSLPGVVEHWLGKSDKRGRIDASKVVRKHLQDVVGAMAEQMADPDHPHSAIAMRNSFALLEDPPSLDDPEFTEEHDRGEVLVACVMGALINMWDRRMVPLKDEAREQRTATLDRARAAEEGATAADHLLTMCIRSLDYIPPLEFQFVDFLEAILVSDIEIEPDDKHDYRGALREAFKVMGIAPRIGPDAHQATLEDRNFSYEAFNHVRMRADPDELFRFIWENQKQLKEIDLSLYTNLEHLREVVWFGADGFIVSNILVDYVQRFEGTPSQVKRELGIELPADLRADKQVALFGGGVLVFDQFGRAKTHVYASIRDGERQRRRFEHLLREQISDSQERFGFSAGKSKGQRYVDVHRQKDPRRAEKW